MRTALLEIDGLHAGLESGQEILQGLSLTVRQGETHVIMGPNGAGKSTLAHVVMGHPDYAVTGGQIRFEGGDITKDSTDARARKGLFLSFQTPEEVDGVTVENFLRTARSSITGRPLKAFAFRGQLTAAMEALQFDEAYAGRYLNVGFSGGEKKKNEILQLLMLNPKLALLDETDSGLDVDAVKSVTAGVKSYKNEDNALVIISHSTRLLEALDIDYVHILAEGRIVHTAGPELVDEINRDGFARFTANGAAAGRPAGGTDNALPQAPAAAGPAE